MKPATPDNITGWVLAGGQGLRMGGVDKGLQIFQGEALAKRALNRLSPQVKSVCLNANRHLDAYRAWGCEVHPDATTGFGGPLLGFMTCLNHCPTEWLMVVPCDSPFFPLDLVSRLSVAAHAQSTPLASVRAPEMNKQGDSEMRPQPVFVLMHISVKDSLQRFLDAGGRKIDAWTALHPMALVDFKQAGDTKAFANVNTLSELAALQDPPT